MRQISHNMEHEPWVVPKWQTHLLYLVFCLEIAHHSHPIRFDHKVQFENKLENLVQSDQKSIVWASQETFLENVVQIRVMQLDKLFKKVYFGQIFLQSFPLGLNDGHHEILIQSSDKIVHLVSQELQFAQIMALLFRDTSKFNRV